MKRCDNHAVIQWLLSQMQGMVCFRNNVRNHRALGGRGCDPIKVLRVMDPHEQSQQTPVEVDAAGRMSKVPLAPGNWTNVSNVVKWDAWNRIVEVQFSASVTGAYAYDALHRRIKRTASGVTWHSYFNDAWKVIEERRASHPAVAAAHYLWGLRHRDDLARRDRATTAGGSMSQRHYVLMDYHSPVAITGTTGTVQERYQFDGFGTRVVLNASNDPIVVSAYAWSFAFQGQFEDEETGWLNYGLRYYAPGLGRFLSKDPIMEAGGNNLYRMSNNAPVNAVDWLGLACPEGEVMDDAGRCCCPNQMQVITLNVKVDGSSQVSGHAWLDVAPEDEESGSFGHYPAAGFFDKISSGTDDANRYGKTSKRDDGLEPTAIKTYRACDASRKKAMEEVDKRKDQPYSPGNKKGAPNCVGWACQILQDTGFQPPLDPEQPSAFPRLLQSEINLY